MIGQYNCEDIKNMVELSAVYKKVALPRSESESFLFMAGNEPMIKLEEAKAAKAEVQVETEEAARLSRFLTEWKGGWNAVRDGEWAADLLAQLK